ncbi:MAG TPA: response regulator [Planctomycetaceae bacterium]|nr:response regulator [Planctomycetaceae bacterium]
MAVLVVDDSQMTRIVARKSLNSMGVTDVIEAADGQQALTAFQSNSISVIFSDWNMPNMNGFDLLKNIRAINPTVPFIMITTEGSKERVVAAIQSGVSDYLVKPYTPAQLRDKLSKWIAAPVG